MNIWFNSILVCKYTLCRFVLSIFQLYVLMSSNARYTFDDSSKEK